MADRGDRAAPCPGAPRVLAWRRAFQVGFFLLFVSAPALDLLRFDLHETQLWVLGTRWSLGIDALARGEVTGTEAALTLIGRGIVPALLLVAAFLAVARRYGRLYCGWLCPHFSAVETLNDLLHRASGRLSLWEPRSPLADGRAPDGRLWPLFVGACAAFGFTWAVTLLSYLIPPAEVWGGLVHGTLAAAPAVFLAVATALFTAEMLFARHLFCRFGCAVGFFQSLVWMGNPRALVMAFDRDRAAECRTCRTRVAPLGSACDSVCPMRLQPRRIKRLMFSCAQCGRCLQQCGQSHVGRTGAASRPASLHWVVGVDAVRETLKARQAAIAKPDRDPAGEG